MGVHVQNRLSAACIHPLFCGTYHAPIEHRFCWTKFCRGVQLFRSREPQRRRSVPCHPCEGRIFPMCGDPPKFCNQESSSPCAAAKHASSCKSTTQEVLPSVYGGDEEAEDSHGSYKAKGSASMPRSSLSLHLSRRGGIWVPVRFEFIIILCFMFTLVLSLEFNINVLWIIL